MEIRGHQVKACISPTMAANAEHNVIRIPEDTRNKLDVTTGQRIRIKNRFFTVRQTTRVDLDLMAIAPIIGQDECVLFSTDHWRDEDFTDLGLRGGQATPAPANAQNNPETDEEPLPPAPVQPTLEERFHGSIVRIQGHAVVVCVVTGNELSKDRIGVPKALRDMFGVAKGDTLRVDGFNGAYVVDPSFKVDLEIYKEDLKETEMIFVNPNTPNMFPGVTPFSKRPAAAAPPPPPVNKVKIEEIVKKIEDVVGPKAVVVTVDKIKDKNKEEIYTVDLTWSGEFISGRASGYDAAETVKEALADLQKNLISLVEDANVIVESMNELGEDIK